MKFLLTMGLALLFLSLESVAVKYLNLPVARPDVTVAIVAFLALRADLVEGAVSSFGIGYLMDLMSGRPTGLYTFLAVLTFLIGRIADSLVDVRSSIAFAIFAMGADLGHGVLATFLNWLTSKDAALTSLSVQGLPLEVALTGLAALLLHPLLKRVNPTNDRSRKDQGLLR